MGGHERDERDPLPLDDPEDLERAALLNPAVQEALDETRQLAGLLGEVLVEQGGDAPRVEKPAGLDPFEIATVAAVSEEIAEEALALIEVEYEVLPAVFDENEAIKPGAPVIHGEPGALGSTGSAAIS